MKTSAILVSKAGIIPKLNLGEKTDKGVHPTGPHTVKIIEDKAMTGKDPQTGSPREIVRYILEENGEKRKYDVPIKDKGGELHYLIQRMAQFKEGDEIVMEMKKRGIKNYIDVHSSTETTSEPMEDEELEEENTINPDDINVFDKEDDIEA